MISQPCIAPADFIAISEDLTFEPFQANQTVELTIVSDGFAELTEQFSVVLMSEEENVLIQSGRSTLQIVITDQTGEYRLTSAGITRIYLLLTQIL